MKIKITDDIGLYSRLKAVEDVTGNNWWTIKHMWIKQRNFRQ